MAYLLGSIPFFMWDAGGEEGNGSRQRRRAPDRAEKVTPATVAAAPPLAPRAGIHTDPAERADWVGATSFDVAASPSGAARSCDASAILL